jgi:hypothetical protein
MDFCHSSLPSTDPSFTEDWWQCVRYAEKRLTQIKHPIQHFERTVNARTALEIPYVIKARRTRKRSLASMLASKGSELQMSWD